MAIFVSVARNIIFYLFSQYLHLLSEDVAKAVKVSLNVINLSQIGLYCKLQLKSYFSSGAKSQTTK